LAYRRSDTMEQRIAQTRARILQATRQLVARGGFREAQVAAIAADAGVSTGLIYRYFPSKAELFVEVLSEAIAAEIVILRSAAACHASPCAQLAAAIDAFVRRALAGPMLAYAFIAEPVDAQVDAERIRGRRRIGDVFANILCAGITCGEFPAQDVDVTSACIVGAFTEALVGPVAPILRQNNPDRQQLTQSIRCVCLRAAGAGEVFHARQ